MNVPRLKGIRVLVVDDDDATREESRLLLEAHGAEVATAVNGEAALEALETQPPDVVLMDLGMPGMDGFSVVEELRRRPASRGGGVPVGALTGYMSAVDQARAFRVGFQAYLIKPVEPEVLVTSILTMAGCD